MKHFVVYKSSAGSGKTFTLVKEYLRLALSDENRLEQQFKRILAVTFTNKAAAEMKSRVLESLEQIAHQSPVPFTGTLLSSELGIAEPELRRRAGILLGAILHHYSDFAIGTIDSFTHKIVKTFAHDLKLPVNFTVELDTKGFYNKVVSTLISKTGEDAYISKLLTEFVLSKAEENEGWDPEKQIQQFSELLIREDSEKYLDKLKHLNSSELEEFRKEFAGFRAYFKKELIRFGAETNAYIQSCALKTEDFHYGKTGAVNLFKKAEEFTLTKKDRDGTRLREALEQNSWLSKTFSNPKRDEINRHLSQKAEELLQFFDTHFQYYSLCEVLYKQMYPLMLLKKIEEITLEQKQEDRLVFISEFNQKIFDIVHQEPTPFIYERLGERYRHFLLDEFQDTSTLQWHNMLPLIDNSLSNGWFNLIVGDGKQSIYRWRNANVTQFDQLPRISGSEKEAIVKERENNLVRNFEDKRLNTNFRSAPTIVEFNNRLFDYLSKQKLKPEQLSIYEGQEQALRNNSGPQQGYVSVVHATCKSSELNDLTCSQLLEHINESIACGYAYRDICVLAITNRHGNLIASFLTGQGFPVVSSDSLLLKSSLEVSTLVSLLQYIQNPDDHLSGAQVLRYLLHRERINEERLHVLLRELSSGKHLFGILSALSIHLSLEEIGYKNLLDTCVLCIKALAMEEQNNQYLRFFLDEVNEFMVLRNTGIGGFLDWWETRSRSASLITPDGVNAIRIMTIHASKGLEFPVVIVPFCAWKIFKSKDEWVELGQSRSSLPVAVVTLSKSIGDSGLASELSKEEQAQVLDNLNVLYVAFTRAVSRLHVIAYSAKDSNSVSTWLVEYLKTRSATGDRYELGNKEERALPPKEQHRDHFALENLRFDSQAGAVHIKTSAWLNHSETEAAKAHGILVHWLLSQIDSEEGIEAALQSAKHKGLCSPAILGSLRESLLALLRHPDLKACFQPGLDIKKEAELITAEGHLLRPDRIVFDGNDALILDYKTGKPNPEKYKRQLQEYADALSGMGYRVKGKILVYVDELSIVRLN